MTTQANLTEVVLFNGKSIEVDTRDRFDRLLEDAANKDDAATLARRKRNEAERKDAEQINRRKALVSDYSLWCLAIARSPLNEKHATEKLGVLLKEFAVKAQSFVKEYEQELDGGNPDDKAKDSAATTEAKARRMFSAAGLASVSDATIATVTECLRGGNTTKAKAIVDDWAKVSGNAAIKNVGNYAEAVAVLRS